MKVHTLGFPRIGRKRAFKFALEAYWRKEITAEALHDKVTAIKLDNWKAQQEAGVDLIPVGDFAWYDHVLNASLLFGVVPKRHQTQIEQHGVSILDQHFLIGRGRTPNGAAAAASDMTKWFNTNYHYIVPELAVDQTFTLNTDVWLEDIKLALAHGVNAKPVLVGPVTYLWLSKTEGNEAQKLALLPALVAQYQVLLDALSTLGIDWLQLDEPILGLELSHAWQDALKSAYQALFARNINLLVATYFADASAHFELVNSLGVDGVHIDIVADKLDARAVDHAISDTLILSLGVINGRNIWRANLLDVANQIADVATRRGDRLWLAPSCSLLHVPVDVSVEEKLDDELQSWLAFAVQKCEELHLLRTAIDTHDVAPLKTYSEPVINRTTSTRVNNPDVAARVSALSPADTQRASAFDVRQRAQEKALALPALPTTTIGSFPQTSDIRNVRSQFKRGEISEANYTAAIQETIKEVIQIQDDIGLDVLVHGEGERNDMVEYFGELLDGFAFTQFGWVQSYGSRCVKPPVIFGDVSRPAPMTVEWTRYAQSLTERPVKGMLTGPVTILGWSFPREDLPRDVIAQQIGFAIRDEVEDLIKAGTTIIQIDEPAFREGLPIKKSQWQEYLEWAVDAFRLSASVAEDHVQIHTHMCYSEFNDIIDSIAAMDADVITIETSRSNMELLNAFEDFNYPNEIGPGVYDIHSPNIPAVEWMEGLIEKAATKIPTRNLWINPDCGLKTRGWPEVKAALENMVSAAQQLRTTLS